MTISSLVIGEPRRLALIGVILKKTNMIYLNNNKYKRFEWTLNDATGETIVPFWNSLTNFMDYYTEFGVGDTVSINNCGVERVPSQFSKGHSIQLKLVNKTIIAAAQPIENFTPFVLFKDFTDINSVSLVSENKFIWVCGIVSEIGDQKPNLMDDGTRCDVKIQDDKENILNVTIWGEHTIHMFDKLEICGRNREFMSNFHFSALSSDINVRILFLIKF